MNYTSEDFHLQYISRYTLYVHSDIIYDHLVVVDQDKQVLVYMKYDNIAPTAEAIKILSLPFAQVFIAVPHQHLVWVPTEIYRDTEKSLYLDYFAEAKEEHILEKSIDFLSATALYQFDLFLLNRWRKVYAQAHFVPMFEVILTQIKPHILQEGTTLGVHLYDNQADICLFLNGEMHIYNTFEIDSANDLSYFVLNIFQNFDLKNQVDRILLSGAIEKSEIVNRLLQYTTELNLLNSTVQWEVTEQTINKELESLNILKDSALCV